MAPRRIEKDDVREKFLITLMYARPGSWPHETIAACKIIGTDAKGKKWASNPVYRNSPQDRHAEEILIEYLRWDAKLLMAKQINITIYMNYSPCSECSQAILDYINAMKSLKREIKITIAFATFYNTHEYRGHSQENADKNIKGLVELYREPGVKLQLIGEHGANAGHVSWETFLAMSEFFSLSEQEKRECLGEAGSDERINRETVDIRFWNDKIVGIGELASGLRVSGIN